MILNNLKEIINICGEIIINKFFINKVYLKKEYNIKNYITL